MSFIFVPLAVCRLDGNLKSEEALREKGFWVEFVLEAGKGGYCGRCNSWANLEK